MKILALESSTTSAKAMLYDTDNNQSRQAIHEYAFTDRTPAAQAEQVFLQMIQAGKEAAAGEKIDAISLSETWHSVMLCNERMEPVTRVYQWNDTESAVLCGRLRRDKAFAGDYYHRTGCMVNSTYPAFHLASLKEQGMSFSGLRVVSQGSYNTYRLTGEWSTTRCLIAGSGLLNINELEYDPMVLEFLGLSPEQMSPLIDTGCIYSLSEDGAALLGLQPGIPVVPANSDGGLNQVGAGALKKGVATLSLGTSGAIRLSCDRPVIPDVPSTWCYYSPGGWIAGAATNGCCNCVDWAKNKLFFGSASYAEMEEGVTDPVNTPVFLPFLFGERCPGWNDERTGGFAGIKPYHTAKDLYLAVQEGVLFNLYQCYRILTEKIAAPQQIMLSGGILNSERWTQMCADIFGVDMTVCEASQGSLFGAVVMGMAALGVIHDPADYQPKIIRTVHADPDKAAMYGEKFTRYLEQYI